MLKNTPISSYWLKSSVAPPPLSNFIKLKWWTTLEAAFVLTDWPRYGFGNINLTPKEHFPADVNEDRPFFYLPYESDQAIKDYENQKFQEIFHKMNDDINHSKLKGRYVRIDFGVNYLVNPMEVILWAKQRNYSLPQALTDALNVKPTKQKQKNPWLKKIKVMTVGQCYSQIHSNINRKEIIDSEWMEKYAKKVNTENEYKQLRDDLKIVLEAGKRGRPLKNGGPKIANQKTAIKRIPQVLKKLKGCFHCDFALLETLINTAVRLKSWEIVSLDHIGSLEPFEFIDLMLRDELIMNYYKGVPEIVQHFIINEIEKKYSIFSDIIYWESMLKVTQDMTWSIKLQ